MAAPPNDLFVNALILPTAESGGELGTTLDALSEGSEPVIFGTNEQTCWYTWTCPTTGWYKWTIPVAGHVYRGNFSGDQSHIGLAIIPDGALADMSITNAATSAFADIGSGNDGDVTVAAFLTSGVKYYIKCASNRTSGILNSHVVDFSIEWEKFTPPANDDFANAVDLGALPALESGTTLDATFQTGSESINYPGSERDREQSVWFKFTAPATGRYRVSLTDPGTNTQPVGTGTPNQQWLYMQVSSGTSLATIQSGEIDEEFITFPSWEDRPEIPLYVDLVASTVYYVRLSVPYANKHNFGSQWFNRHAWEFELSVEQIAKPANDDFANAEVLSTTLPNTASGTTYDATEEASEPSLPYTFEQSVWYEFTPAVTGKYRFRIKKEDIDTVGHVVENGELVFSIKAETTLADHTQANVIGGFYAGPVHDTDSWLNQQNAALLADLVNGTTYKIKVNSNGGSSFENFNAEATSFVLDYQAVVTPANDDFANAEVITGSSGTEPFTCLGATGQMPDEPQSFYWNGEPGVDDPGPTVWFSWTCPASGYYKFTVEADDLTQGGYDLAIYTGAALNALTRIASNWGGDHPNTVAPRMMKTTVGINAVNGTTYKIQVNSWGNTGGDAAILTWATLTTPVGDTAAAAVTGVFNGLDNNFGHSANDPPPDFVTLASAHDYWWYNDGQPGKTKWYKYTATQDSRIQIKASQYLDDALNQQNVNMDDWGIIAYKGANYASLVVAEAYNYKMDAMENVVMFPNGSLDWESEDYFDYLSTSGTPGFNGNPAPVVDVAAGETLWICLFGVYDDDYNGDGLWTAEDAHAPEVSYDLFFSHVKPPNDDIDIVSAGNVYGYPDYLYDLRRDDFWGDLIFGNKFAGSMEGTTFGAGTQAGELAHGGFGPTRSVWFVGGATKEGQWKIWVESPEDCTLSVYTFVDTDDPSILVSLDEDDDSGAGNFPECIVTTTGPVSFWIAVDSKVATNFSIRYERINDAPVIPANDNFDDAVDLGTGPVNVRGTTVGGSAEYFEKSSIYNSSGPSDSVWYKWTSKKTGVVKVDGRCLTNNWDGWVILDVWEGPDKDNLTLISDGSEGGILYGPFFPNSQNDPVMFDAVNGNVYYFRLMTEEGSSEEFELWVDTDVVYLKLIPGGTEDQPNTDFGIVPLKLTPSGTELKKSPTSDSDTVPLKFTITSFDDMPLNDAAEVYLKLTPSGTEGIFYEPQDSATVNLALTPSGVELHAHLCFAGEGNPELRFYGDPYMRFETDPLTPDFRWFSHLHKGAQYC